MAAPRKRTQTKPADPEVVEAPEVQPEEAEPDEVEAVEDETDTAPPVEQEEAAAPELAPPTSPEPAKSDLQAVEAPCSLCFPNGWPDLVFAVGCEHGTWYRPDTV